MRVRVRAVFKDIAARYRCRSRTTSRLASATRTARTNEPGRHQRIVTGHGETVRIGGWRRMMAVRSVPVESPTYQRTREQVAQVTKD